MKHEDIEKVLEIINANIQNDFSNEEDSIGDTVVITEDMLELDIFEMGMDSIGFIRTIVSLEEEFSCEIPDEKILFTEMNTVSKILDVLSQVIPKYELQ